MPDHIPLERLQPCLLDRLTDDEPDKQEESRNQRVISIQRYKRGVLRDLEWLFNASAHLPEEGERGVNMERYPEAFSSVINYGIRHLCGLLAPDMEDLERTMVQALRLFEPRIIRHSVKIKATMEHQMISFELQGEVWANPVPEELFIRTKVDLESGQCLMGDAAHG
jgi:type VI secretion system protein ImpF